MISSNLSKKVTFPIYTFLLMLWITSSAGAQEQVYVPLAPTNPPPEQRPATIKKTDLKSRLGLNNVLSVDSIASADANALPSPAALPQCTNIPTLEQISGNLEYHQAFMSTSSAAKLGIPVGGNFSGSGNQMVLVRDFSRGAQCPSTDGTTTLFYGQAIRTVVSMSSFEGKGDLTLPFIAASASLNNKSNQVSVIVYGFANPKIDTVIANIAGKELNVETYSDFIKVERDIIALIPDPQTTKSVVRLGAITNIPPPNFIENVITAYALYQIGERQSCIEAKSNFRNRDNPSAMAIDEAYKRVVGACDVNKPSQIQSLQAKELLLNLKVKY